MIQRTACALVILNLLSGCATTPLTPIRRGEPVSLKVTRKPQAEGVTEIGNDSLGKNAGAGTGSGALVGGLWGLTCGPWFFVCSPAFAAVGALTGTIAGAAVGTTAMLAEEKAAKLRERVNRVQQSHPLLTELQKNISDRAHKFWKLNSDQPASLVTVELQDLLLTSTRDETINCTVQVVVSVQRHVAEPSPTSEQKMYEHVATPSSLSVWLDESNDFVDTLFTSASQQIAAQIVADLALIDGS